MLHIKFREIRPAGSGGEEFLKGHVTQNAANKLSFPYSRRLHIKFGFDQSSGFGEEDL